MEDGRPAELAPYRWWAEGKQRGCQTIAVEEAGAGGRAFVSLQAFRDGERCPHTHQITTPSTGSMTVRGMTGLHSGTESLSEQDVEQEPSLGWTGGQEPSLG